MIRRAMNFVIDRTGPLEAGLGIVFFVWLFRLLSAVIAGRDLWDDWSFALLGMLGVGVCFAVLLRVLSWITGYGSGVVGVASTVIKEALNIRLVGVVVLILVVMLPWMAVTVASEDRLSYRIQAYLEYSLSLVLVVMSLMTVLLGCRTLSKEVEDKQIMIVGVKPVSRPMYLVGKWLGVMFLNVLLVLVSMGSVYWFTAGYLANQKAKTDFETVYVKELAKAPVRVAVKTAVKVPVTGFETMYAKAVVMVLETACALAAVRGFAMGTELEISTEIEKEILRVLLLELGLGIHLALQLVSWFLEHR